MSQRFVSIGECMVELAPAGQGSQYALGFAGDTLNTAWYARRLLSRGWQVDYATAVGEDAISARMIDFLQGAGLGTSHIQRRGDRTVGLYLIELTDGERSFAYWRSDSAARRMCESPEHLEAALGGARIAYFSGITLAILPAEHRMVFLDLLARARRAGTTIAFDPNLRPKLWTDKATMCAAIMEAARVSDIALPSHEDEATHFGDASPRATAHRYRDAGVGSVLVKNGAGEMVSLTEGGFAAHAVEPVREVVDTTAAGDSFNAGFLAAHLEGAAFPDAVGAGAALAAQVIGKRGALVDVADLPAFAAADRA
jgi:2-dehydro-3-deoxygluconokinase